jgi:signal transduction histidine kinase/CheY-like chemotaxis protein
MFKNTYPKIIFLIFSSSVFFIILYYALYSYTIQVKNQVYVTSNEQFTREAENLLVLDSKPILVGTNNDSSWDEFVDFLKTKDVNWYNETIGNELDIYNVDYMGAYDINGNFVIRVASSKIKSIDFIPKQAMKVLNKLGLKRFYMKIPEGIIEVVGASIHPSNDPSKNKTKSSGYFFVARLLDTAYIKNLEKYSNSEIKFYEDSKTLKIEDHHSFAKIYLRDFNGKLVNKLSFKRNFEVYFENTINILYLIFIAFILSIIANLLLTRKWVFYPLDLITKVLETGDKKAIHELKNTTSEFGKIGKLFEENNNQKVELITAKVKAEEGERLKSAFLANLSHEIRTPMNAINGFTDLLINTKLNKEEKLEYLKVIEKSGKNLVSIIDDLIEMSKIDANQIIPNNSELNLESFIDELYETIKITIPKNKKIDFKVTPTSGIKIHSIIVDETKLKQVIINLVNNAIKFTESGHVSFGYEIDNKKNRIVFKIEDTGIGIHDENRLKIFDRFKQVEGDLSIESGGLGLGLAISKAYVELMGGEINVESIVEKGSVFSFYIPLKIGDVQGDFIKPKIPVKYLSNFKGNESKTILVAEDDNMNFLLLQKIIQMKHFNIIRAVNGQDAVEICTDNSNIDLVLMDIKMPIMGGFEALKKIKKIRPELIIIAQTAFSSSEDQEKIYEAGFNGYITKPINREKLFEIIDGAFRKKNDL